MAKVRAKERITQGGGAWYGHPDCLMPHPNYIHAEPGDVGEVVSERGDRVTVSFQRRGREPSTVTVDRTAIEARTVSAGQNEAYRRVNDAAAPDREALEARVGQVWDPEELRRDFDVVQQVSPFLVVVRRADRRWGTMEFQQSPFLAYSFEEDEGRS